MEDIKPDDKLEAAAREYSFKYKNKGTYPLIVSKESFKAGAAWKEKEMQEIIEKAKKWDDHCSSWKNVKEL